MGVVYVEWIHREHQPPIEGSCIMTYRLRRCVAAVSNTYNLCLSALQSVFPWDDPERDPESPRALHRHGAGRRAEPDPAAAGQRGVPFSRHRHQPAADVQGHPGTSLLSSVELSVWRQLVPATSFFTLITIVLPSGLLLITGFNRREENMFPMKGRKRNNIQCIRK